MKFTNFMAMKFTNFMATNHLMQNLQYNPDLMFLDL